MGARGALPGPLWLRFSSGTGGIGFVSDLVIVPLRCSHGKTPTVAAPFQGIVVPHVIACDKRVAFAQGSACDEPIYQLVRCEMDCFVSLAMTLIGRSKAPRIPDGALA